MNLPKAITPDEAQQFTEAEVAEAESVVQTINMILRRVKAGNRVASIADPFRSSRVAAVVVAHFRQAGWTVEFESNQREGDFYWFGTGKDQT